LKPSREEIQDKSLDEIKLLTVVFELLRKSNEAKSKNLSEIYENAVRYGFQQLNSLIASLTEISPDPRLGELSNFLTRSDGPINVPELEPQVVALHKYLLATLL